MTLAAIHHNAIKAWLAIPDNMGEECRGQDRVDLNLAIQKLDQNEVDVKFSQLDEPARRSRYKKKNNKPTSRKHVEDIHTPHSTSKDAWYMRYW
mmetsp:Transcript_6909/g.8731  ORF Transcript_6909/g.8731 Transcript_6909/m.8731 type:complete len:94 (+) Transcript_6909:446-727(+)